MKTKEYSLEVGGKTLTVQFTDLAEQASGSVIMRYGNTVVLVTAVMGSERDAIDYFPLTVDYEERFYAGGKIQGSRFVRREGRPSDEAVLSGRIVDRTIRPLFESHIRNEVQVVATVLSIGEDDPDILGVIGASLALGCSNIPWNGPVSAIRIGKNVGDDKFIVSPTYPVRDAETYELDLVACGKDGNINMIEVGGKQADESVVNAALKLASEEIEKIQAFQEKIIKAEGVKKTEIAKPETPDDIKKLFAEKIEPRLDKVMFGGPGSKNLHDLKDEWIETVKENLPEANKNIADRYFEDEVNDLLHEEAIRNNRRPDGRGFDDLRPLFAKAGGISPILHGTGIFYRGATHILSALTLGGPGDAQLVEGMEYQTKKRFMHHYNFPPFSTGETGRLGGMNRRAIGHGALAEKALIPVLPTKESFPYTIRIVSEAFSSNGSTSMGSVCGSTLSLMDAGVPISAPVAGIASGLMMSLDYARDKKYKVLTDIQGPEDHHGDMDFKVAGTRKGITAVQMDVKVDGIPLHILAEAFVKAKSARERILDVIENEIALPRANISPNAPKIIAIKIKPDQIGLVIGTGGKTINEIRDTTGVDGIDIEDDGTVFITGKNGSAEKAQAIIEGMTKEYKVGEKFEGEVVRIADFGAFVRIGPNAEGLVHVSEIAPFRVENVGDVLSEGDMVPVVVINVDETGRIKLSIKQADADFAKKKAPDAEGKPRSPRPPRFDHRRR
ncbi:MAG: polyribonucleotide nucleotidyltransferase [Candidatus Taylorbacteria bacterium RIFCSPLOWO2_02_FULL_43_11]|uniref:Polyribonucleotide nucleotidyltransferase n=1 Tax=Candidatus Taylorbacteria bacterium RIFCSPHIGHO2_02_FULL_43_32b TaxID=1802306 RepID=A0A1G2MI96_9BACT|nr:MAG: polyribonucleotide nucleotidyltransferase [Candidatus Taylorbacteria bacterium RIFCSPHIGHO2_01_FULL_43_47]OHA23444.1 MAG: polyribonucleotide nucleotidyltransferase [Candidatus Taylorbacteria bacterium RIFCSPHIGHO2_02_FULL_43_32b]OHA30460.1 MAG: polyribonucleotide nucleotidyltransferase [Candidatus Taylorbacteria bacterium RIFCSPLOWO2_01_FULL_43_44]OHA37001.1 MAG: polyribonucleotide nucleotidyltransferase [Candidatus Taylorbacteria bacterium RIFCSPLOWO2_02_FULL_43_11]